MSLIETLLQNNLIVIGLLAAMLPLIAGVLFVLVKRARALLKTLNQRRLEARLRRKPRRKKRRRGQPAMDDTIPLADAAREARRVRDAQRAAGGEEADDAAARPARRRRPAAEAEAEASEGRPAAASSGGGLSAGAQAKEKAEAAPEEQQPEEEEAVSSEIQALLDDVFVEETTSAYSDSLLATLAEVDVNTLADEAEAVVIALRGQNKKRGVL
ncbi:MAG: hypothetical protein ACOCXZ_00795 [Chloroflexota bacterium]